MVNVGKTMGIAVNVDSKKKQFTLQVHELYIIYVNAEYQ